MLPTTLALIDDDREYTTLLSQYLGQQGMQVDVYADSSLLLGQAEPYRYGFYIVDLLLRGVDGVNLIKLLRQRSRAGILVVSGRSAPTVFKQIVDAGADMHLSKPVPFEQVALAIMAVQRRAAAAQSPAVPAWVLLECFIEAAGEPVTHAALRQRMEQALDGDSTGAVSAAVHRLRRRIELATEFVAPLQARSGVGYVFRAPLLAGDKR